MVSVVSRPRHTLCVVCAMPSYVAQNEIAIARGRETRPLLRGAETARHGAVYFFDRARSIIIASHGVCVRSRDALWRGTRRLVRSRSRQDVSYTTRATDQSGETGGFGGTHGYHCGRPATRKPPSLLEASLDNRLAWQTQRLESFPVKF